MKWQAVIILAAIVLGIFVPPSLPLLTDHGTLAAIGTLDVCHAATPALSSNGGMPCVGELPCHFVPFAITEVMQTATLSCKPPFMPFQDEHPPKA